jgi:hypothetical protein
MSYNDPRKHDREFAVFIASLLGGTVAAVLILVAIVAWSCDVTAVRATERCRAVCGASGIRALEPCECEHGQGQRITVQQVSR